MTSIERTAYPRLKRRPSAQELADVYTPTVEDLAFIRATARGPSSTLTLAVLLKVFQRLGHLPRLQDVPFAIVTHVRSSLRLPSDTALDVTPRTLYRHHEQIRAHLQVKTWGAEARHTTIVAVHQAAQVMDHPADLINVAIEDLVRQRYELPAFSTLDTLATHVRAVVHRRLFAIVLERLSDQQRKELDDLLETDQLGRSAFNALKRAPKRPSLSHLDDLVGHVRWLQELREPSDLLAGVPPAKVRHFAAEARSLDAAELKDITAPKRYTLMLTLISRAQVQGRDDLAEMFGKRMALFETRAKEELALIRDRQRETTEMLVGAFADVLQVLDGDPTDAEAGPLVKQVVAQHGDVRQLLASCEAIAAYNGDNYYPLMWRFYRSHRSTLFRLAHTLRFVSTTRDTSVMDALELVLANEDRTGDYLPAGVNLSFASEQWLRTVLVRTDKGLRLARRHFEVCTFAALAAALKAGDVAVEGSDAYADYREQLLPWSKCEPQVVDYCQAVELPATAAGFVKHLQELLETTAKRVDAALPSSGHVVINDKGEPVIKRGLRRQPSASAQALEAALLDRMPERNLLDMLANVSSWTQCFRHLGPLSGSEPKIADPVQRYILTVFAYGCNLGPTEAARHMQGLATAHELSFTNRRHVSVAQLEAAIKDLVNAYHRCDLPKVWGSGSSAAADGTKYELAENSLLAECWRRDSAVIVRQHCAMKIRQAEDDGALFRVESGVCCASIGKVTMSLPDARCRSRWSARMVGLHRFLPNATHDEDDHAHHPRHEWRVAGDSGRVQSRVSSATAFLAQSSSTSALPAVVAAIRAATATLLSARGRPRLALCSRATASSAISGSLRPASAKWCCRYLADSARSIGAIWSRRQFAIIFRISSASCRSPIAPRRSSAHAKLG